jgi:hypothetical protein
MKLQTRKITHLNQVSRGYQVNLSRRKQARKFQKVNQRVRQQKVLTKRKNNSDNGEYKLLIAFCKGQFLTRAIAIESNSHREQ